MSAAYALFETPALDEGAIIARHAPLVKRAVRQLSSQVGAVLEREDMEQVSQPGAFSNGTTTAVPESQLRVEQGEGRMFQWPAGARLQSIIDTVNSTGATPDDIMAILQALDQAGAIDGELVVI